uniref:Domain of unknown function DB domain-containing protein n=1 Tax=Panagrellus redivivus TaxID=6233 RepID=A0A7E4URD4_PANRE
MWLRLVVFLAILFYCEGHDAITSKAVTKCCPADRQACCFEKLAKPHKPLFCTNDTETWDPILLCLEKELYKFSMAPAETCCDLLYRDHCKEACHDRFQNPILSVEEKLAFPSFCMRDYDFNNIDCFTDSYRRLHFCYPQCVLLTMLKLHHDKSS